MALVRLFAAAADAAGTAEEQISASSIGELHTVLVNLYGDDFNAVLDRCTMLVNGARADSGDILLAPNDLVDVLPPFAGG